MENFNQIFTLLSSENIISFNSNILETGVINIILLIGILIYVGNDFLGSFLTTRKTVIVENVQDAENRLNEAIKRLEEAQKQLSQANLVIADIKRETLNSKKFLLESDAILSKKDLQTRFNRAFATLRTKERQIFLEIKEQIIFLVLKRLVIRAQETFGVKERATIFIDEKINNLKGDLL